MAAGATNVASSISSRPGDGQVTITFDPTTDACPSPPPPPPTPGVTPTPAPGVTPAPGTAAVAVVAVARFTG
jgi:hypothetical protein